MPAQFTLPLIITIPGQLIASSLWNNEFVNLFNNLIPAGIDNFSHTDVEMQTNTDPFPGGVTSHATSLQGEIERLRFLLKSLSGETFWYNHPVANISAMQTSLTILSNDFHNSFPVGTRMFFQQTVVPSGWTRDTSFNGNALRVASGTPGSGGSIDLASSINFAHSHTVNSHTHGISSDGAHTHTTPNHTHSLATTNSAVSPGNTPVACFDNGGFVSFGSAAGSTLRNLLQTSTASSGSGTTDSQGSHNHTGATGTTAPGTDSQLSTFQLLYLDVILGVKS